MLKFMKIFDSKRISSYRQLFIFFVGKPFLSQSQCREIKIAAFQTQQTYQSM